MAVCEQAAALLAQVKVQLPECEDVEQLLEFRDKAEAMRVFLRQRDAALLSQNDAAEIKLRTERRLGELTKAQLPKLTNGEVAKVRWGNDALAKVANARAETLKELGIGGREADHLEALAGIPQDCFENRISEAKAKGERILSARSMAAENRLEKKRALAEEIRANPIVTPDGRYQVIVSDPPWRYGARAEDASHRGKNQYPDMSTEEICALPVERLAQDDCILWLWTTNAFMRDAYRCLDAWGFREKTILTWDKELIGLGDWLRNVTEHCILAVRGKPIVSLTNQTTIIREKRREHSRKPEAFYALVEALCPGSKLEMFSRAPRDGWAAWGAETEKFQ